MALDVPQALTLNKPQSGLTVLPSRFPVFSRKSDLIWGKYVLFTVSYFFAERCSLSCDHPIIVCFFSPSPALTYFHLLWGTAGAK